MAYGPFFCFISIMWFTYVYIYIYIYIHREFKFCQRCDIFHFMKFGWFKNTCSHWLKWAIFSRAWLTIYIYIYIHVCTCIAMYFVLMAPMCFCYTSNVQNLLARTTCKYFWIFITRQQLFLSLVEDCFDIDSRHSDTIIQTHRRFIATDLKLEWITVIICVSRGNYIHYKVCYEITYQFPNFHDWTVEVCEWIIYLIPRFTMDVITYVCLDIS